MLPSNLSDTWNPCIVRQNVFRQKLNAKKKKTFGSNCANALNTYVNVAELNLLLILFCLTYTPKSTSIIRSYVTLHVSCNIFGVFEQINLPIDAFSFALCPPHHF